MIIRSARTHSGNPSTKAPTNGVSKIMTMRPPNIDAACRPRMIPSIKAKPIATITNTKALSGIKNQTRFIKLSIICYYARFNSSITDLDFALSIEFARAADAAGRLWNGSRLDFAEELFGEFQFTDTAGPFAVLRCRPYALFIQCAIEFIQDVHTRAIGDADNLRLHARFAVHARVDFRNEHPAGGIGGDNASGAINARGRFDGR